MIPMTTAPIIVWLVYKVHTIETAMLTKLKEDMAEVKNDIKWLIEVHKEK